MDDRVATYADAAVDVNRRRILERDAGCHQLRVLLLPHDVTHCRELDAAVDAANLVWLRDGNRFDRTPLAAEDRDKIRQVILLLRVGRCHAPQGLEETFDRECVDSRIDLANSSFRRPSVALLDNTCNLLAGSHD